MVQTKTSKVLATVLLFAMVFTLMPGAALAEEETGGCWVLIGGADDIADAVGVGPVIITVTNEAGTFALSNYRGTSAAPIAIPVEAAGKLLSLEDGFESRVTWYLSAADEGYVINADESGSLWLYSTNINNGVRVGTNSAKTWVIDSDSGYLKHVGTSRYLGVYNNADWRAYTNTTGNIAGQTLQFWKFDETAAPHEHDWGDWSSNGDGTHSRSCAGEDCPIGMQTEDCIDEDEDQVCDVCGGEMPQEDPDAVKWVLIEEGNPLSAAAAAGIVTFTMTTSEGSTYAISNNKGTGNPPAAIPATIKDNTLTLNSDVSNETVSWTIDAEADGTFTIYSAADSATWLYSTNANNGVRVGTNSDKGWFLGGGYLRHSATGRYLGVYNGQDWRAYTSPSGNGNIVGQNIQFWKLTGGDVSVHEHDWSAWTSNGDGTHSRSCQTADCPIGSLIENCSYDEGTVTIEPGCVEEGERTYACFLCGYSFTEAIPATGNHVDEDGNGYCDVCGEEMPTAAIFTLGTELHEGDRVVIFSPYASLALSTTASGRSLKGVAASISGEELTVMSDDEETAVMTVEYDDATNFRLKLDNGEYLTSPATGDGLSFAAEASDYTLWNLSLANENGKTVFITNANAKYNGNYQRLEYYGAFTAYGYRTAAPYQFQLYILANPDAHVHDWDEGTVTAEPSCTAKGVRTFACSGCDETYTEDIPMIPHADGDADGLCDACEGRIFTQAESLNDGDSLILVTGAFGKAMTGTESSNGGYMAAAEINAQEGVTVPVAEDNVWTVKTADEGFYLINNAGQYLYVNESNKLALGDEESSNILWTVGESVEDLEPTGAYLYNPGAEKYIEYGKKYNNYQTYDAPTENYETCYAFTFYTLPAPMASYSLAPTEFTLAGAGYTDIECSFTSLVLGLIDVGGGETEMAESIGFMMNAGTLTNEDGGTIPFLVDDQFHFGAVERANTGVGISDPEETVIMAIWIDPEIYAAAAPGIYTGTFTYESDWNEGHPGEPGSIELTLVVPEPETLDDGFYLLIAHAEDDWVIGSVDPANKFELNGNAQNEWLLSTTLAVGDEIKVVRVENNAITGWWPDGPGTQYHVDEAHSGNVTIYFKTDYVDAWRDFGGYFYIGSLLKPELFADVYGCSVSLKGNIGLNFYLIPSEQLLDDDDAYVSLGDEQIKFSEAPSRVVGEDTLYQFSVSLHAKQMNDVVTLKVFDGQGNPVALYRHSNDEDLTETGYSYSVQDYIQKTRETSTDEELIALVNAMADYGVLAQRHFDYNTEDLPEVQGDLDSVTAESVADYEKKVTAGTATGVSFAGGSLALKSATAIRLYFSLDEGEIGDYTFKLGTRKVTPTETDLGWMVEIPNIAAKDLDKTYTVKVTRGADTVLTVQYSALSYAYGVLGGGSKAETLIDLVKGIVLYNRAANAYFG